MKQNNNSSLNGDTNEKNGRYMKQSANNGEYHGRYEAEIPQETDGYNPPEENAYDEDDIEASGAVRRKGSAKDVIIKIAAILLSLVIIIALILNLPIIAYNKSGNPTESISIITFIKRWQPLVSGEGELEETSMNLNVDSQIVHEEFTDGLDLPQIIEGQYSILFLGFDEDSNNSDVNWIFQFDIAAGKMNVLQIPRDTFMPYYSNNVTGKFNSIYSSGDQDKSPIQRVVNAVEDNFGIPIDAYVTTNCYDIVDMVDLVGGIPITLDEQIMYEADKIIPAGETVLNGQQAEWFVRYRHGFAEGDIGRVKNQRKFLAAAMEKMLHIYDEEGKAKFYSYLKEIYENEYILTDLSLENISMIADFASTLSMDSVTVNMVPGEGANYAGADGRTYSVWSVHKQATLDMLNEFYRPYQTDLALDESALIELVTDYRNTANDNTIDSLDELQNGVKPGQNKTEPVDGSEESSSAY